MGFWENQVVPRAINVLLGSSGFGEMRARSAAGLSGEVLEVGFGSGLNLPHYPPEVTKVLAVDPSGVARGLAADRVAAAPFPVEFVGLDGEHLPLPDDSVDGIFITWTLCTIPDPVLALSEMARVLRPDGAMHFLEHGRSPDPAVARRQERLTPIQRRVAGGCHLDRHIDRLISASGFRIESLATFSIVGPKTMSYMYAGQAVPSA